MAATKALAAASLLLGSLAHTGMALSTASATQASVEVPPAGGTRPIAAFGVETGAHAANDQVALRMDADIAGGLFVKGFVLSAAQFKDFDAACTKGNAVNVYEWGYGSCDDYMVAAKANAGQTTFTASVAAKPDGSGATLSASVALTAANAGPGLFVVFENLLGAPVIFSNAQVTVNGAKAAEAGKALPFPAATVHMSAAVVRLGDRTMVDEAEVKFTAAGTAPTQAAKPTALMVLNEEQLAADKLGCTMGFYFGWFKRNEVGLNVCKGIHFHLTEDGDVLTVHGTVQYIPSDQKAELLAGPIQVDPAYSLFQGDGAYTFATAQNGAQGVAALVPNRLDTPLTLEGFHVEYTSTLAGLLGGPIAGIAVSVLAVVAALMAAAYAFGKRRAAAAQVGQKGAGMV